MVDVLFVSELNENVLASHDRVVGVSTFLNSMYLLRRGVSMSRGSTEELFCFMSFIWVRIIGVSLII